MRLDMTWNFFEPGNGKGEHDGVGAFIKRALINEQLKVDDLHINCVTCVYSYVRDIKRVFLESEAR